MRILFYPPFKPLDHPHPSGDLVTAMGLFDYLGKQGHQVWPASSLRCRWIYWKPWLAPRVLAERQRAVRAVHRLDADLWFTYHSYYKAPDLLGPYVSQQTRRPYVIFQAMFSTKRKRALKSLPGYLLNNMALRAAGHVFLNRTEDLVNLKRFLPDNRLSYIAPGIHPEDFCFDPERREALRQAWEVGDDPVVLSAAMFRPGVKLRGLSWVIRACGRLVRQGRRLCLVIVGDGQEKKHLQNLADRELNGRTRFVGLVPRKQMHHFYSAGDIFAFPGFRESLGMVYLEAQSSGLPVVAMANGGIPEVVRDGKTGLLTRFNDFDGFATAIDRLLKESELRLAMSRRASVYVREKHDLDNNYRKMITVLEELVKTGKKDRSCRKKTDSQESP